MISRWSYGLVFHQALIDGIKALILLPLGISILNCEQLYHCSLIETGFLVLVTVSTINFLTIVLNDSPIFPYKGDQILHDDFNVPTFEMNSSQVRNSFKWISW